MESKSKQQSPEEFVSVYIPSDSVLVADNVESSHQSQMVVSTSLRGETESNIVLHIPPVQAPDVSQISNLRHLSKPTISGSPKDTEYSRTSDLSLHPSVKAINEAKFSYSFSFTMPFSPSGLHISQAKRFMSCNEGKLPSPHTHAANSSDRNASMKDKRFDSFKTWSGKLERQISNLRGIPQEPADIEADGSQTKPSEHVPEVGRYFDALEGPELETLRPSEVSVLPEDKLWPFLLRFPISAFGMCLGVSSQAMLWKAIAEHKSLFSPHVCLKISLILWCISLALVGIVSAIYIFKIIFYFEAVRREYYHPVRVNFFFAPWIACLFLAIGIPQQVSVKLNPVIWYVLMAPIFCLEIKIYGQWMSGGQRRLSKVANPSNHLSIVGNFVGALLGAKMGLTEGPIFFFAVGLAHYMVLFVTLYQRLPTNATLPKDLHPVFFLFVAAPSVACVAWAKISGDFNYGSRIAYFIALFLYVSLAVRVNFFRGFRFSLSWWAYTFPMTGAAIATIKYSMKVPNTFTKSLSIGLSVIAAVTVMALLVATVIHAFVLHNLFPNDIAIAISGKRPRSSKKHRRPKTAISDMKDVEGHSMREDGSQN